MTSGNSSFSLRSIAVAAFGPSLLFGLGQGSILPIIALSARELGASLAVSGLIVSLFGLGALVSNIPAALIAARYGERRSMVGAATVSVLALILCLAASAPWMLALGILIIGMASSVFLLARQTFLIEAVPVAMRARALSTLGGVMRVGLFLGPFAGAALMHFIDLPGAYWVAIAAMTGTGLLSFTVPELESRQSDAQRSLVAKPRITDMLRTHGGTFATLGLASALVAAVRSCRQIVIPLWASHLGLDAATTAVVYGVMGSIDMLLFYPAGKIMDHFGRQWVAAPSMILMGIALALMPLTTGLTSFVSVCLLLGFGNGISSGLNMTVGADASPQAGRTQFLGIWRLITDCGAGGGPLLLSGIMAISTLSLGIGAVSSLGFIAAAVFWRWLPRRVTN